MRIARAMTMKIVFNRMRIACANLWIIMHDYVAVFFSLSSVPYIAARGNVR
jgi:hypothetical protein